MIVKKKIFSYIVLLCYDNDDDDTVEEGIRKTKEKVSQVCLKKKHFLLLFY